MATQLTNEAFQNLAQKAAEKGTFLKVSDEGEIIKGELKITGIKGQCKINPNFGYNLDYRLAGDINAIRAALLNLGISETDVNNTLSSQTITCSNYQEGQSQHDLYLQVLEQTKEISEKIKEEKKEKTPSLEDLNDFMMAWRESKKAKAPSVRAPARKITSPRGKRALIDRLRGLSEGKVLDVSNFDKIKSQDAPKPGGKSAKYGFIDQVRIISNNYESYKKAMDQLAQEDPANAEFYMNLAEQWRQTYGEEAKVGKVSKTPRKVTKVSPKASAKPGKATKVTKLPGAKGTKVSAPPPVKGAKLSAAPKVTLQPRGQTQEETRGPPASRVQIPSKASVKATATPGETAARRIPLTSKMTASPRGGAKRTVRPATGRSSLLADLLNRPTTP